MILSDIRPSFVKRNEYKIKRKQLSDDFSSNWFHIKIHNNLDISSFMRLTNLHIDTKYVISNNWFDAFLSDKQIISIQEKINCSFFLISPDEKVDHHLDYYNNIKSFLVHADDSLGSYQNIKYINITKISNSFFKVESENVAFIVEIPCVYHVSPLPRFKFQNRWSSGLLQSGDIKLHEKEMIPSANRLLNNKGINGDGVVVTIIDSGVDITHSFFRDDEIAISFYNYNPLHRKIVKYDPVVDNIDEKNGHGTFCAGVIAGVASCNGYCPINEYRGHAPNSKLYVIDIGQDEDDKSFMAFELLIQQIDQLENNVSDVGSNIISCSWCIEDLDYLSKALLEDHIFAKNKFTMVFAAGNSGEFGDISSPADCKNVITVGASTNSPLSYFDHNDLLYYNITLNMDESNNGTIYITGTSYNYYKLLIKDMIFQPFIGQAKSYQDYKHNPNQNGQFYVVFDSIEQYQSSTLRDNDIAIFVNPLSKENSQLIQNPYLSVNKEYKSKILAARSIEVYLSSNYISSSVSVAQFSSRGPTKNGILKPEVIAPGCGVLSAASGTNSTTSDSLRYMDGTSISAPAISGILALIEQYIKEVRYQFPSILQEDNISPTLFKAFLVQSSSIPTDETKEENNIPNTESGFGIPNLKDVIIMDEDSGTKGLRFLSDTINHSNHYIYRITTNSIGSLKVTLSWLDKSVSQNSNIALCCDLDLFIITPNNQRIYYGNNNRLNIQDSFSTTEKIDIESAEKGEYEIHVISHEFIDKSIEAPFSIVVNGNFNHSNFYENPPLMNAEEVDSKNDVQWHPPFCYNGGYIVGDKCICSPFYTGYFCQNVVQKVEKDEIILRKTEPRDTLFFALPLSKNENGIHSHYLVINSTHYYNDVGTTRIIVNTDNKQKLTIKNFVAGYQNNLSTLIYIDISTVNLDIKYLYVTMMCDYAFDGLHSIVWWYEDFTDDIFDDDEPVASPFQQQSFTYLIGSLIFVIVLLILLLTMFSRECKRRCSHNSMIEDIVDSSDS